MSEPDWAAPDITDKGDGQPALDQASVRARGAVRALAMILGVLSAIRVAFGLWQLLFFGPSLSLAGAVVATGVATAYLLWLALRGRHELRRPEVSQQTRKTVVAFAVATLLVLPLAEVIIYRTFV